MNKTNPTIFQKLQKANICFAVVVSVDRYKTINIDVNQSDWFIVFNKHDHYKIKKIVAQSSSTYRNLLEITLSDHHVEQFKAISNKFTKVTSNQYGRVYEITANPFKNHINSLSPNLGEMSAGQRGSANSTSPLIANSYISGRCRIELIKHGYTTWQQVTTLTLPEIQNWYRVGVKTIREIKKQLKIRELKLKKQ